MTTVARGACLCGAVQFAATLPSLWCAHCHCSQCQRAHGAGVVTWVGFASAALRLSDDQHLRWYASSAEAERGFCQRCGASLFFRSSRWPGEIHIARANFTDSIDHQPEAHVYYASHVDWLDLADTLPRHAELPDVAASERP
jgi:hypothetical protein